MFERLEIDKFYMLSKWSFILSIIIIIVFVIKFITGSYNKDRILSKTRQKQNTKDVIYTI